MTDSIQGLTEKAGVPRDFIGMIPLPILTNDGFQVSALIVSILLAQQCILDGKSNCYVFTILGRMMIS